MRKFCEGKQSMKTKMSPYESVRIVWQVYCRPIIPFQLIHRSQLLHLSLHHPSSKSLKPTSYSLSSSSTSPSPAQQNRNALLPFLILQILHHPPFVFSCLDSICLREFQCPRHPLYHRVPHFQPLKSQGEPLIDKVQLQL